MMSTICKRMVALLVATATFPLHASAWTVDSSSSSLSFVTVKAGDVGEVHTFGSVSGSVSAQGNADVTIDLASVDTLIPIRDERMREFLFDVASFPTATVNAAIDLGALQNAAVGEVRRLAMKGELALAGAKVGLDFDVSVARLTADRGLVATRKPVIVNAATVDLVEGVERLREIAKLPSISKAVPVSFVLGFEAQD